MLNTSAYKFAILLATCVFAFSSAAYAGKGGRDNNHGNNNRNMQRNDNWIWPRHENGCAVGEDPPPGANCTNRNRNK